jgi:hypothetical protein
MAAHRPERAHVTAPPERATVGDVGQAPANDHTAAGEEAASVAPGPGAATPQSLQSLVLGLQSRAGNAAVGRLIAGGRLRPLLRAPPDNDKPPPGGGRPIDPPGKGFDILQGDPLPRNLTPEMENITRGYRGFLEGSRNNRGAWSRQAGNLVNSFKGTALERATLYGELQRQMGQVHRSWFAEYAVAQDGAHVFLSNPELARAFVVHPDGTCWYGPQSALSRASAEAKIVVDYAKLSPWGAPPPTGGGAGGAAPPAAGGARPPAEGGKPPAASVETPVRPPTGPETPVRPPTGPETPVRPPVADTPIRPPTTEGPVVPPEGRLPGGAGSGGLARSGIRWAGVLRFVRSIGIQMLVMIVIGKVLEALEQARVEKMFSEQVEPEVQKQLKAVSSSADKLGEEDPFRSVYANITLDIAYRGSRWHRGTVNESVDTIDVKSVSVSREKQESQETISDEELFAPFSTSIPFRKVVRMTYSVEMQWDSTIDQRLAWTAEQQASKGQTARSSVLGHGWNQAQKEQYVAQYVLVTADDPARAGLHADALALQQELAKRGRLVARFGESSVSTVEAVLKKGMSARDASDRTHWGKGDAQEKWVACYVEVTRGDPAVAALHQDAVEFLAEIRAAKGPFGDFDADSFFRNQPAPTH